MREDLELLQGESPVTLGCSLGALLQPGSGLSYSGDGNGLPGPVGVRGVAIATLQGCNGRSSVVRIRSRC